MQTSKKKYIITGAPGTGKTTLLNELKKEVPCMEEVSRKVILKEQESGGDAIPWKNIESFVSQVYEASIEAMENNHEALFCDRSILDLIAYLRVAQKDIPNFLTEFPYHKYFHSIVFFAPLWKEIYCKDAQRLQEYDYCDKLEIELLRVYKDWGFRIVLLPMSSPSNRSRLIKKVAKKSYLR